MEDVEAIWEGDLFGRRAEAEQIVGYLETVTARPSQREDGQAFVLAVDAPYGEGKSYFLRRFAKHMAMTHPVAFVDAWTDDLEDEPLVALAATLEAALSPYARSPELQRRIRTFKAKAGEVARIVGVGLLKRAASFVIMESGAEAVGAVVSEATDLTRDLGKDVLADAVNEVVDEVAKAAGTIVAGDMDERIARFRAGRQAIDGMKAALRAIVEHLRSEATYPPPVVIVIDELDRCRPTYAIKLLEEVKHLFDVEGLAFVLGMHGRALGHSVSAAYGAAFDGSAYLDRFVNRRYLLKEARLEVLIERLMQTRAIPEHRLGYPGVRSPGRNVEDVGVAKLTSLYMSAYGMRARDSFLVVDVLETCLALTGRERLFAPLLLPLICAHVTRRETLGNPPNSPDWFFVQTDRFGRPEEEELQPLVFADELDRAGRMDVRELMDAANKPGASYAVRMVSDLTFGGRGADAMSAPRRYRELLVSVSRFSTPSVGSS